MKKNKAEFRAGGPGLNVVLPGDKTVFSKQVAVNENNYTGKNILITGGASRSGKAIAAYLLEKGANLVLPSHSNAAGINQLKKQFPDATIEIEPVDLNSADSILEMAAAVSKRISHLDGLINTVGSYFEAPVMETPYEKWSEILRNNLDSVFLMCQQFHHLLENAPYGRVLNFSYSNADRIGASRCCAYHIAKMGVIALSKSLAKEWGNSSITVNVVSPGTMENSIIKDSEKAADYIPAGRFGSYADLWPILDLIFKEESNYLTGNNFIISGGYNL